MSASLTTQLQALVKDDKVYNIDQDFINIMGANEVTQSINTNKFMDKTSAYSDFLVNSPPPYHHHHTGDSDYTNVTYTSKPTTPNNNNTEDITTDLLVTLDRIIPDVYFPQGTIDSANPVSCEFSVVPEESSGESPSYTDLSNTQPYIETFQNPNETYIILQQEKESVQTVSEFSTVQVKKTPENFSGPCYFPIVQTPQAVTGESYNRETSEDSILPSELSSTQTTTTTEETLTNLTSPGYNDYQQVLLSDQIPFTDWSPVSSIVSHDAAAAGGVVVGGPMSTCSNSSSSSSSNSPGGGWSDEALTPSPVSPPRGRKQNKAGGPVRGKGGRGRRNSATGGQQPPRSTSRRRRSREKKVKLYERDQPFADPKKEKKRLDAINSKRNRDKKKSLMDELKEKVTKVLEERDEIKKELETLRKREARLQNQYINLQQYLNPYVPIPATSP
ncbi:hypothetical protein Pcinc_022961 [Petrolisthes cinctipes]|uniref:BZIP domain-containing protein n=1 Tax=Petrolisthes cinctipes TaxID=88211 RepID=A0AAE1FEH7_PETCI|nr:hypothetical protein Pcinc_022961 [Petrolisthes cinctipes]